MEVFGREEAGPDDASPDSDPEEAGRGLPAGRPVPNLRGPNLAGPNLPGPDLPDTALRGPNLPAPNLPAPNLRGPDLPENDLPGAGLPVAAGRELAKRGPAPNFVGPNFLSPRGGRFSWLRSPVGRGRSDGERSGLGRSGPGRSEENLPPGLPRKAGLSRRSFCHGRSLPGNWRGAELLVRQGFCSRGGWPWSMGRGPRSSRGVPSGRAWPSGLRNAGLGNALLGRRCQGFAAPPRLSNRLAGRGPELLGGTGRGPGR